MCTFDVPLMSPTYGEVGSEQPMASFIDSTIFPKCNAAPGATYAISSAPSDVARCSAL